MIPGLTSKNWLATPLSSEGRIRDQSEIKLVGAGRGWVEEKMGVPKFFKGV